MSRAPRRRLGALIAAAVTVAAVLVPAASSSAAPHHGGHSHGGHHHAVPAVPATPVIDGKRMQQARIRLDKGDPGLRAAVKSLTAQADSWLGQGPWTVTDKPAPAPGGDPHDYLSQAPYWWPSEPKTEDNPWGCPYVQRDGERNPEVDTGTDRPDIGKVFNSTTTLSLAWYYTGEKKYAEHAADDSAHLVRGPRLTDEPQPGPRAVHPLQVRRQGHRHHRLLAAVHVRPRRPRDPRHRGPRVERGRPCGHARVERGLPRLARQLSLRRGGVGRGEQPRDLHGHADSGTRARDREQGPRTGEASSTARAKRIDAQIAGDGTQPQELARTRSWHYSTFDLVAYTRLAAIGKHVGVDLWAYRGPQGQSLSRRSTICCPRRRRASRWPHPELEFYRYAASDIVTRLRMPGTRRPGTHSPNSSRLPPVTSGGCGPPPSSSTSMAG